MKGEQNLRKNFLVFVKLREDCYAHESVQPHLNVFNPPTSWGFSFFICSLIHVDYGLSCLMFTEWQFVEIPSTKYCHTDVLFQQYLLSKLPGANLYPFGKWRKVFFKKLCTKFLGTLVAQWPENVIHHIYSLSAIAFHS